MRLDRLFHVLVVMSGPVAVGCETNDDDDKRREDTRADAGVGGDAAAATLCFCNTETCCDRSGDPHVLDGFECCWGTTCP